MKRQRSRPKLLGMPIFKHALKMLLTIKRTCGRNCVIWASFVGLKTRCMASTLDELNAQFAGVSVSPLEDIEDAASVFEKAGAGGFAFRLVGLGDVELPV